MKKLSNWEFLLFANMALMLIISSCEKNKNTDQPSLENTFIVEFENGEPSQQPSSSDEYKSFYGICWAYTGEAEDNCRYAKNMGYKYAFYQDQYYEDFHYYIESPHTVAFYDMANLGYWGFEPARTYTREQKEWLNKMIVWKDANAQFPNNLAIGCIASESNYMLNFDFQREEVIDSVINNIFLRISKIKKMHPDFKLAGFAFDAPELTGEFHNWIDGKVQGVSLEYWTGKDCCACGKKHDYDTYSLGMAQFFVQLWQKSKELNPDAKIIMEPYWIHSAWIEQINKSPLKNELSELAFVSQEGGRLFPGDLNVEFFNDDKIYSSGLLTKDNVGCSTPDVHLEKPCITYAAKAATNGTTGYIGSWNNWYGRFGGDVQGDKIDYNSIKEVPCYLKLLKVLPNWENLSKVPLSERHWNETNRIYESTNSYMDDKVIATRNPYSGKLFVTFIDRSGTVPLDKICSKMDKIRIKSVKTVDEYMGEVAETEGALVLNSGILKLAD